MKILDSIWSGIKNLMQRRPMTKAEVDNALAELAATKTGVKLAWRHSVVDLLKLLGLDSSPEARKELAAELGYEGDYTGTTEQNQELQKRVMDLVAERCVPVPKE